MLIGVAFLPVALRGGIWEVTTQSPHLLATRGGRASRPRPPLATHARSVAYDSLSIHDAGLMVNLLDNERYRRVCFEPGTDADGTSLIRFYHHTHDQAALDA